MTASELEEVLDALNMDALDLVRKNEALWKEEYRDLELGEDEIILAMIENPRLMERPIILNGDKAVVARPAEKAEEVLQNFLIIVFSLNINFPKTVFLSHDKRFIQYFKYPWRL